MQVLIRCLAERFDVALAACYPPLLEPPRVVAVGDARADPVSFAIKRYDSQVAAILSDVGNL